MFFFEDDFGMPRKNGLYLAEDLNCSFAYAFMRKPAHFYLRGAGSLTIVLDLTLYRALTIKEI